MYTKASNAGEIMDESRHSPVIVFKHSITCPISAAAKRHMDEFVKKHENIKVYLVVVQSERELSNDIESVTGVKHESPQVIYLSNGEVISVLNHYDITLERLEKEIQ